MLEPFQTLMVAWIVITRKFICTLDTGLGKTVVASAVIKWLYNSGETKKFLYVVENAGMRQTAKKVKEYTDLTVRTCNAARDSAISLIESHEDFDILMISYQALQSYGVAAYLVANREMFQTVIYDECQWLSELNDSNTWEITVQMRKYFRDVIMFSATPFKTNPMQMLKQVELLDHAIIGNINKYIEDKAQRSVMYEITDWYGLDRIKEDLTLFVNGFTREELGIGIKYEPHAHVVNPVDGQCDVPANKMHEIKGFKNSPSMDKLIEIVSNGIDSFEQGIIYCSTNTNKALLKKVLEEHGIESEIIDGSLSNRKMRDEIQRAYLTGEVSVLIVNITTTLDLPSNYCVLYELCDAGTMLQFIGRCVRGLGDSDLAVHFILVKDTYEIDYFYDNLYVKSKYLQQALGKDGRLVETLRRQVRDSIK